MEYIECMKTGYNPAHVQVACDGNFIGLPLTRTIVGVWNLLDPSAQTSEVIAALEGHLNRVTCAEFCPHYSSTLVTISEDRTFKVWNIADLSLVYQSTIITASPFISMSMNLHVPQVAIGTADGIVRVYDLSDGKDFRCVHQINIGKIMDKYRQSKEQSLLSPTSQKNGPVTISSKPSYQRRGDNGEPREEVNVQDVAETGCAVLGLYFSWVPEDDRGSSARSVGFLQRANTMISEPMLPNSILKQGLVPKQKEDSTPKKQKGYISPGKPGQGVKDQPLTFQSKIKSSGYTEAPRTTMFKPKTSSTKQSSAVKKKPTTGLLENALDKEYPTNPGPPKDFVCGWDVAERPTPINAISYSGDGLSLACALANKSAQVFRIPYKEKGSYSLAHNHIVNDVQWSCDSSWLVSACDDKTVRLWQRGQTEAVLTISTKLHNLAEGDGPKKDKENAPFPKEIKNAQFYYMDRFLILTSSNTLYMYKYHLDPTKQDIKRYVSKSKYKQVQSFTMDAQYITALSAVNDFYSYIVMCAGSSKSLEVYDMNVGKCVRTIADIHTRPVHCIKQHEVYVYDIRGGTYCSKLTGFTDTVSAVAFHPLHSQLMTASLDGKLKLFTDSPKVLSGIKERLFMAFTMILSVLAISFLMAEAKVSPDGSLVWPDLGQLYALDDLRNGLGNGYYDLESRSSPNQDWSNAGYQEPTLNDDIFSEASIRDQEYQENSPLWGYQSVSGGTGDGKDNPKQVKTDKVLPAYCNPPNPCPIGYTSDDNCVENFENSPDNNRKLMKQQECPCDKEHMFSCPSDTSISTKSGPSLDSVIEQLGNMEAEQARNPYFDGPHNKVAAKKGSYIPLEEMEAIQSPLMCYPMRFEPGADLQKGLLKFTEDNGLSAAFVITCVGSVTKATLRMANSTTIKTYEGHFEIVSLVGTLSSGGHLHMSISDAEGNVFGGHVFGDVIVYTTAEVIVGNCPGAVMNREEDKRTGYKELTVQSKP
uniref:WD repeat-containing protein 27 n=1 Tax=Magallana gigas TaxID=29159 RepID=K1P8Z6_MAGGI